MTSFSSTANDSVDAAAHAARVNSFCGVRNEGMAVSEIAGVVGGILGGCLALSAGGSKTAAVVGGLCGAAGGYAMGNLLGPISNLTTSTKIVTGLTAGCFGISVASLGAAICDSFKALSDQ